MKRLVVLGLVLLIMPECAELKPSDIEVRGQDDLTDGSWNILRHVKTPSSWSRIKRGMSKDFEKKEQLHISLKNHARRRRHTPPDHHHRNLADEILQEIHRGHVTQEKIMHWYTEIQTALHNGDMTMTDYHTLINALKSNSKESGEHCCMFG